MTYADNYSIRTTSVKFNDVADALDGLITRNYAGLTTGTSTTYIATPSPAWDAYTTSGLVVIIPHVTNTGAATINISGLGARDLRIGNAAIAAGVLQQNIPTIMADTGTYFEVLLQQTTVPVGAIYTYAGTAAPTGYLLCDGTSYNTYTYRVLHAIVSNTYGGTAYAAGVTDQPAAVTTFQMPDLRRRMPIGKGASDTLGGSDGVAYASRSITHSHTIPAHYHGLGTLGASSTGSAHTHNITVDIGHAHAASSVTGTVGGADGLHRHSVPNQSGNVNVGAANQIHVLRGGNTPQGGATGASLVGTDEGGHGHSHNLTASGQTLGSTSVTATHASGADGSHTHTMTGLVGASASGNNGDAGTMASGSTAQPYLILNYIIKT